MMLARDYRQQAWGSLGGKWGTMALATLVMSVVLGACSGLSIIGIGAIALLLLTGPFSLGYAMMAMKVIRGNRVGVENLFDGFKNFLSAFLLSLINSILIALWSLLFVIPGIIKTYSYSMSYYILADNPTMTANDARKKSMEMMRGNKWRLFCLHLSFIGWLLLCMLTLGILTFWIQPYMQTAEAAFYQSLLPEAPQQPTEPEAQDAPTEPFEELHSENADDSTN